MDNPFIYNKAVTGDYFVGHDSLVQSLHHQFKQHRHTLIEGPFGWGKTSLVSESINRLAYGGDTYPHCWIDCLPFRSEQAFYQGLIRNIAKTLAKDEPWHQLATRALQQRSIAFSFRSLEHSFVLELFDIERNYAEILDLIELLAREQKVKLLVCLDNFENLSHVKDPNVLSQRLRSIWQHHHQVTYCFISRARDFLHKLFESNIASFHSFGEVIHLTKLDAELLVQFICKQFCLTGKEIAHKHSLALVNHMQGHPYYVQLLAHTVWAQTDNKVLGTTIIQGLELMLARQAILFETVLAEISNSQFNYLKALASGLKSGFTKQKVLERFQLGSSANVIKIQRALIKKEVIMAGELGYQFQDPAFALWFKWNILK